VIMCFDCVIKIVCLDCY